MADVKALVLAAGLSRRYGGPNKLLQPWEDTSIVGAVARTLINCGLEVVVVTGRDAEDVALATKPAQAIFNPSFEKGIGTSIAFGVAATPDAAGWLICLGDMPDLRADVVNSLLAAFDENRIAAPVYREEPNRPGHPVLFGKKFGTELMQLQGDHGAKSILEAHRDALLKIPIEGSLEDIDTPP